MKSIPITKFALFFVILSLLIVVFGITLKIREENNIMKITSPAFGYNQSIPAKYTCDGENINPPLIFSDAPVEAKSLALIMEDPDVPKHIRPDSMWDHWLVWDIPAGTKEIKEGAQPEGVMGKNSGGGSVYAGPCPPDREHRYFFKFYALDISSLHLSNDASKKELQKAMNSHILAEAELIGLYQRQ